MQNRSKTEFVQRTDSLAEAIGVPLRELHRYLGFSATSLFNYRSGVATVSRKAWRKLEQAESIQSVNKVQTIFHAQENPASRVDDGMVAPYDRARSEPPTRGDCAVQLQRAFDLADKIPGGLSIVYSDLTMAVLELQRRAAAVEQTEKQT